MTLVEQNAPKLVKKYCKEESLSSKDSPTKKKKDDGQEGAQGHSQSVNIQMHDQS